LLWVSEPLATVFLHGAVEALTWIWIYLEGLSDLDFATWHLPRPTPGVAASAVIGTLLLLAPRGVPGRFTGLIWLLPLFPKSPHARLRGSCGLRCWMSVKASLP
jgi:competence protein ComEC